MSSTDAIEMPDLGGAPMPGEGLDMNFLKSFAGNDSNYPPAPTVQSNNDYKEEEQPSLDGTKASSRRPKANLQPISRDDFSPETMDRMRKQREAAVAAEAAAALQMQQQQQQLPHQKAEEDNIPDKDYRTFFERYQYVAVWAAVALLVYTTYLLYTNNKKSE